MKRIKTNAWKHNQWEQKNNVKAGTFTLFQNFFDFLSTFSDLIIPSQKRESQENFKQYLEILPTYNILGGNIAYCLDYINNNRLTTHGNNIGIQAYILKILEEYRLYSCTAIYKKG